MAIISVARYKFDPSRVTEAIENGKKAKEIFLANGAERVDLGNILAGTAPGEWAYFIRYPDLATMEQSFKAVMADPDSAKIFMDPNPPASLTDRTLYTLIEL